MIKALIDSAARFENENDKVYQELSIGYEYRPINWIVDIDSSSGDITLKGKYKDEMIRAVPMRADRSGKVSKKNIKPNLFVDNARYALGLGDEPTTQEAFKSFRELHENMRQELIKLMASKEYQWDHLTDLEKTKSELDNILRFLNLSPQDRKHRLEGAKREDIDEDKKVNETKKKAKKQIKQKTPEPNELVAFTTNERYPFNGTFARLYWKKYIEQVCSDKEGLCSTCGAEGAKILLRILPFKLRLFGERCPLLSVNTDEQQSFGSLGKDQLVNSPICIDCAGMADRLLKYLTQLDKDDEGKEKSSGRHAIVLERDERQALGNQLAVFWTKEQVDIHTENLEKLEFEDLAKVPIEDFDEIPEDAPPVKVGQCKALLESPFVGGRDATLLPTNRFFLAVLSPNKSRLVVREWLETDIEPLRKNIKKYLESVQIIHPDGRGIWWPPLPSILEALQSYTSVKQKGKEGPRIAALGTDVTRKLIRCIYTGTPPPEALLTRALRCFHVPDPPTDNWAQKERQMRRRMAMAAAMKLVITYNKNGKEQKAMQELKTDHDGTSDYKHKAPYNCGVLLAILEAVQRRTSSSGRGVNTTLVDRFYGAASTAPATVFANLINMATKAHLPKLRREGKELFRMRSQTYGVNINELMQEACAAIDNAGGFPTPLTPQEQAEFALGFYHQRAELNAPKSKSSNLKNTVKPI